jgi:hypothetical protein
VSRRRRLRTSQPIPDETDTPDEQATIPLNIAPINDWRTDTEVRAVGVRTSWGKILATRERALNAVGVPLRFVPATAAEIVRLFYQMGGASHHLVGSPLILVRLSAGPLGPLVLLSLFALAEMEEHPAMADRVRVAIEIAVSWIQDRGERSGEAAGALLLLDSGSSFPIVRPIRDNLQDTPPPFRVTETPLEPPQRKRRQS